MSRRTLESRPVVAGGRGSLRWLVWFVDFTLFLFYSTLHPIR